MGKDGGKVFYIITTAKLAILLVNARAGLPHPAQEFARAIPRARITQSCMEIHSVSFNVINVYFYNVLVVSLVCYMTV